MSSFGVAVTVVGVTAGIISILITMLRFFRERRARDAKLGEATKLMETRREEPLAPTQDKHHLLDEVIGSFTVHDYASSSKVSEQVDNYLLRHPQPSDIRQEPRSNEISTYDVGRQANRRPESVWVDSGVRADPAPLGLSAFALTTFVFSLVNAGIIAQGSDPSQQVVNLFLPLAIIYGGFAQLIAGILEFWTGNTFGVAGFGSFGSFWIALAVMNLMARQGIIAETRLAEAQGWFFLAWAIFTAIMLIATFGLNVGLVVVFALLFATLVLLTIGNFIGGVEGPGRIWVNIGGYVGIITALAAWYVAAADVINDTLRTTVLPIGEVNISRETE